MKKNSFIFFLTLIAFFITSIKSRNPFVYDWRDTQVALVEIAEQNLKISFHKENKELTMHVVKKSPST
ncbi:MAG: hypothetical protein WA432_01405 [Candidatus Babeliaceae bacterium]